MGCRSAPQLDMNTFKVISRKADWKIDKARVRENEKSDQDQKIRGRKRHSFRRKTHHRRQYFGRSPAKLPE